MPGKLYLIVIDRNNFYDFLLFLALLKSTALVNAIANSVTYYLQ
jgi:hypothetical protein